MFIVISTANPDPMYKQVTDQIKEAIATRALEPGTKLPSIRGMAEELKISPITIKRAYADLENEGYIVTRSGLGSFVADVNEDKLRREKSVEIREELKRILKTGAKYGITPDEIANIILNIQED